MRFPQLFALSLLVTTIAAPAAHAAPGNLDSTFGSGGIARDPVFGPPQAVAVQPNGGVIALQHGFVARHKPDGAVDLAWGTDGGVGIDFPGATGAELTNVAVQQDNKIIVVGNARVGSGDDFAVARLHPDGSPDTSFNEDGFLTFNFGGGSDDDHAYDVVVDPAGRIILAGSAQPGVGEVMGVLRLTPQGTLDSNFSSDGRQTIAVGTDDSSAREVAIDSAGRIVLAGYGSDGSENALTFARLTDTGEPDNSWSGDGESTFEYIAGEDDKLDDLAVQPDHKVVITGGPVISATNPADLTAARFDTDGTLDDGFGTAGIARHVTAGVTEHALAVGLQRDGKIVLGGYVIESSTAWDHLAARLDSTGALDPTFGTGGLVRTDVAPGGRDQGTAMAVQSDGRIVLAGGYDPDPNDGFPLLSEALIRLIGVETKLSLTAAASGAPRAGETGTFTFTVHAGDGDGAHGVAVSGLLPGAGIVSVTPSQGSCARGPLPFDCRLGDIERSGTATVTVVARADAQGTYTASATATNLNWDPSPDDNAASAAIAWGPAAPGPGPGNPGPGDPGPGVPPPANREPDSVIAKLASKISAKKLKAFSGTATDDGSLARVDVALVRLDGKKACYWLTSNKGKFKKKKPNRRGECTGPVWLRASGTTKWTFKLKKALPKGKYVLYARAVDKQGLVEKTISARDGNRRTFTLR